MYNRLIATAYHEAGHAVAAWATKVGVTEITIVRGNGAAGHIVRKYVYLGEDDPGPDWQDWEDLIYKNRLPANLGRQPDPETLRRNAERLAMVALAGDVAQRLYNPRSSRHWQFRNDHDTARKAVRSQIGCFSMRSTDAYLDYLKVCVEEILQDNWILVVSLAQELLRRRTLDSEATERFFREYELAQAPGEHKMDVSECTEL